MPRPRRYADGLCVRLTLSVPDTVADGLRALAARRGCSVSDLLLPSARDIVAGRPPSPASHPAPRTYEHG